MAERRHAFRAGADVSVQCDDSPRKDRMGPCPGPLPNQGVEVWTYILELEDLNSIYSEDQTGDLDQAIHLQDISHMEILLTNYREKLHGIKQIKLIQAK